MKFNDEEQQKIRQAIERAEQYTSGEIRICVEKSCKEENPIDRAATYFYKLEMDKTKLRNGVLIYIATADHKFAIIGDEGINKLVPPDFWDKTKESMLRYFKEGDLLQGIIIGIEYAGKQLQRYFPTNAGDKNELSDDIVFIDGD
ncbi:TPM domain-containing protein [Mucilaginibacter aquatilis]|uniref:TPM domain-containing protein n=1 Tax=Mucilaginibacter aquatilis TaxID=1517760 RepID=A0A6I4IQT5_9SPHI|nr:TPM domain-containing protein [Mucilaginibacter aquatilis]MVN92263.1 TPM domain-containing protein [Mucilaginibacter aquatilis]